MYLSGNKDIFEWSKFIYNIFKMLLSNFDTRLILVFDIFVGLFENEFNKFVNFPFQ